MLAVGGFCMHSPEMKTDTPLAERYRALLDIGRTLTGTLSPEELYRAIYRETASVVEATGFYISLYDEESDLATVVFYADRGEESRCDITYSGSESHLKCGMTFSAIKRIELDTSF